MRKFHAFSLLAASAVLSVAPLAASAAISPDEAWLEVPEASLPASGGTRQIVPDRYRVFTLDRGRLEQILAAAPPEAQRRAGESEALLELPRPDGGYSTFRIVESPVMEPGLAARYPQIRTWLGQGVDDPSATVRFDLTPKGFHAQVIGREGTTYVDPYRSGDVDDYIAYAKHDHRGERGICLVTGEPIAPRDPGASAPDVSSGATLRTYRLAMAATGEYTIFHGGTKLDALSAIVTTINRVNGIYEREVSVRMVLVANEDLILFTDPATDPYANTSGDLAANQTTINAQIGAANYDIGHLVGTGGGGVAGLGVVCGGSKARGLTGSGSPVADGFDVDYVAHEMGHQFSGNHTFNGSGGSCTGSNRNGSTAYEPGSGITIQAYAGICNGDNLQPNSDDYFHRLSLNEILAFTTTGGGSTCGTTSATGNGVPTVSTPAGFTIPGRTPFTLTASGSDPDNDALTYVWEQFDLGAANAEGVLSATAATGPMFRGFEPVSDPSRTFPSWRYILANANAVPATAPRPGTNNPLFMTGEVLPNVSRTLNFRVTVRDNRAGGGGTNEASTVVTVANAAGPFAVTAPNTAATFAAGSVATVAWNVAGSADAPVSTANVRITLSIDGGATWPIELASSTPNDGSEQVTLPAGIATTQARVRVAAVGNIFFDVSDADFAITSANTAPDIAGIARLGVRQGGPTVTGVVATVSDAQDAAAALAVSVTGAPPELVTSVQNVGGAIRLTATALCELVAPTAGTRAYPLTLSVVDTAGAVRTAEVVVDVAGNRTPTLGTYAALNAAPDTTRTLAPSPPGFDADGNFALATVVPNTLPGGGTIAIAPDGTLTVVTTAATPVGTNATVRARLQDTCGAVEQRDAVITVGAPVVTPVLGEAQVITGNAVLEPNECNSVLVSVRNDGTAPMTGVSGTITTSNPNATITLGSSGWPDIPPGESRTNSIPFQVSTTGALACFSNVALATSVTYAQSGTPLSGNVDVSVGRAQGANYTFAASTGATLPNDTVLVAASQATEDAAVNLVVPAGFNFSIYGTAVAGGSTLRASTNGSLQLSATGGGADASNLPLPASTNFPAAAPTLFVYWDDWRMLLSDGASAPDAGIYTKLEGTAPNRRWIVEWRGRIRGDGNTGVNNNRVAIVLHENSNTFDFVYVATGVGAAAGGGGATVGVQASGTGPAFTQFSLNNPSLSPGLKLTGTISPAVCAPGSAGCSATPAATLLQSGGGTTVTEGGATDTYTIALAAAPTGTVVVTPTPDAQVTVSPPTLTFTTANWTAPQVVTVTAVDDALSENAHTGTITHAAGGGGYDAVAIPSVVANIVDNDVFTADLAVSNRIDNPPLLQGQVLSFTVKVDNLSTTQAVGAAQFAWTEPNFVLSGWSWTCVAAIGSSCPASGAGLPNHTISVGAGSRVTYSISALIPALAPTGTSLVTTASASASAPFFDSAPANDTATAVGTIGPDLLLQNGFE